MFRIAMAHAILHRITSKSIFEELGMKLPRNLLQPPHFSLELELKQTHMIQKPMLRVEVCTRALCASRNVKKTCVPCVLALLKRVHGRVF